MATWLIGSVVVLAIVLVLYRTFFRKNKAGGCSQCEDVGCSLIDQAKMVQANKRRKA
ncbi:FeoB-associated Cys-rich membrane protein [Lacticaseibacillus zeae]|uniref:FeoB-associated Cys-rich membrane protein n=1 Tax=Lacticaseibacillus zeae TaxID=57037 RepID=UPI000B8B1D8E|nr:FeoB-associated Cys-rich membrane protein [Lacticaseibacillus zeae]